MELTPHRTRRRMGAGSVHRACTTRGPGGQALLLLSEVEGLGGPGGSLKGCSPFSASPEAGQACVSPPRPSLLDPWVKVERPGGTSKHSTQGSGSCGGGLCLEIGRGHTSLSALKNMTW